MSIDSNVFVPKSLFKKVKKPFKRSPSNDFSKPAAGPKQAKSPL
jgi:hypothetical protein